ncbi:MULTISPECIES: hypothetical protein [Haloferax]|uniref:DUF8107 domain-containing protein n=1 Tax=Haloferax marinum TaxID=2666143 RepID=A0A6A8G896_9EURY|nr:MULTISPECIES: hypothetical protein [Haloferax]KAB1197762.1 hypothetical protein Hfx1150_09590 [Haloferax sp. CBA1150]MRW96818.1 hypothetical protein [Haloferax marinum]
MSEEDTGQIEWGEGDPRVVFVMNVILSSIFATVVVYGLSYLELMAFTFVNVATMALLLIAVTYLVTK